MTAEIRDSLVLKYCIFPSRVDDLAPEDGTSTEASLFHKATNTSKRETIEKKESLRILKDTNLFFDYIILCTNHELTNTVIAFSRAHFSGCCCCT